MFFVIYSEREVALLKSFLLPVGRCAGTSLPTLLSAFSCGAALPVTGLDILHITDAETDPVLAPMIRDLNQIHSLLGSEDNISLFPSSFVFQSCRPHLPSLSELSGDTASSALLGALRGKGIPLSYKTDPEAVEWAFSVMLSDPLPDTLSPLDAWFHRIRECTGSGEGYRIAVLCDLCDPFSVGASFAILRYLNEAVKADPSSLSLFCLSSAASPDQDPGRSTLYGALLAMAERELVGTPDRPGSACADAVWLLAMPSAFVHTEDSLRLLYVVTARSLARFFASEKPPASGLHTLTLPGILTFQSLGDQAGPFASFLHASAWLLSDMIPALTSYIDHPAALRSLAPNTRNGLFRRLFRNEAALSDQSERISVLKRALCAVLSEVLSLIRSLPDQLRLAEVSDPLWLKAVEACGRTVTVASEYDVSRAEAEQAGILDIKPVHRVSMADTEEEKAERRLEDIAAQLKDETEKRDSLFMSLGGCWAFLALDNCRSRCRTALERAEARSSGQDADKADRLSAAALNRRIRLLRAAVARCDRDLSDPDLISRIAGTRSAASEGLTPLSGQLLNAPAAEKLFALLSAREEDTESVRREILSQLPSLLYGCQLADVKSLFRQLLSVCKPDPDSDPFVLLCLSVLRVSSAEISPLRFVSAGQVPAVPLLPDLYPSSSPLTVGSLIPLFPSAVQQDDNGIPAKRGLLAMLMLRLYRRRTSDESALFIDEYHSSDSPLLRAWLSGRKADHVSILSLGDQENRLPFALFLPGREIIPARITMAHKSVIPAFASPWFDEESLSFTDPSSLLCEGDRDILLEQLTGMVESGSAQCSGPLLAFLKNFCQDLPEAKSKISVPTDLELRLKAAFGLRMLPAFRQVLVRTPCNYEHFLANDDVAAALIGTDSFRPSVCSVPDDIVFLYRNVPFARESSRTLLEAIPLPAESWILSLLRQECLTLARSSDDYHDHLVRELTQLLDRYPDALPEARQKAQDLLDKASMPVDDTDTELAWPWDPASPSVMTILSESLGETLAAAALQPFSDQLALFPARGNEIIGDSLMASMCLLAPAAVPEGQEDAPAVLPDAVLPPFSPVFCDALCRLPEGRTLLRPGLLSFERSGENSVNVTMTLEGSFTVRLSRRYSEEEILHLYAHDIPTLAVWPNLPFAPEDWKAYFIYANLPSGYGIACHTSAGEVITPEDCAARVVCRSSSFPLSFSFSKDGLSVGAVPNLLPRPEIMKEDEFTACIDFGSVGTSVIFSVGHRRHPLQGPTLVRTLINNPALSRDLLRKEFLPAVPVSALLPTASRIFRNVPGEAPVPFEDGIVLMSADLQDVLSIPSDALYTCLKWEEEKGRSVFLCLHQIMLMAALQARSDGASSLLWRFAIPDEMAKAGRERLVSLFTVLAEQVNTESGFSLPDKRPLVTFAAESSALGAYFRLCASEDTRGGFMVLDIGACTADISLFLRGREQAVRTCQIPLGIHYMLLPSLLRDPDLLRHDLGFVQDPAFIHELTLLEQIIRNAKADPSALRHSRLALDNFIADRFPFLLPGLLQHPATGMPTYVGSVLLLHLSYLMMLSGLTLLQIAADPGKNDFLPEQMSLCLSGRGSILPESLPDPYKTALWHFLTMFRNRRVASLSFLFSSEKKMEIPVGLSILEEVTPDLPPVSAVPAAISVRPEELLPQFLLRFAKEFPASAGILFQGFFTGDFYHPFTPHGESVIAEAISQSFTARTMLRPYDALSAWIGTLLDLTAAAPVSG